VRSTVNQAADTGNMAIAAFKAGDVTAARAANDKVQALLRSGSSVLVGLGQTADDEISAISKSSWGYINRAGLIQYLIGGCILLMILFVCIYAHFVGKILKRKYLELEASEAQSVAFAGKLQEVNDDVTKLNVELAQNVQHLKEAQDEIVRRGKMAQLGQLTATVAHELRNPLAAIRTSTFLMERKVKDKNLGLESQFSRINNGIARCERVISQLLDFARTRSPQLQTISFDEWLQKEIEEEAAKLPEPVAIECHLGAGPLQVAIDPDRMRRAIINLLSNASEAMVGKGDDLSKFTTNTPQIVVETATERGNVFITVSDNGPGMSEEVQKRILEPLFTTKSFGTGLGLPAVEAILHQHGGGLKVESKPGKGARFTAWFPAQHAAQEAA
jgi:signal transduction histidine kinase